ncbi:MAG: sensor histidine kinase [Chloroflexia bacterium]|nr:sensor histidine kinase [Chloroflexia bacterium]
MMMRLRRKHKHHDPGASGDKAARAEFLPGLNHTFAAAPPADFDRYWRSLRNLPYVKDWRVLSDAVFLLLSFALGLFWLFTIVFIAAAGLTLSIVWVGIPILAALFALVIWGAQVERHRLRVFLGVDIPTPYRYFEPSSSPWKRAWMVLRNPQLWRDMWYLLLLTPLGILGLIVVWIPIPLLLAPIIVIFGGDASLFFWDISSFFEAVLAMLVGLVLIVPFSMLINLTALLHVRVAHRFLAPSTEEVLTERVEELTESRSAVMRAMYLERRRIERDLHDGAQQHLVALAMELGRAREKLASDPEAARKLIESSHEDSKLVLAELRDLVRGIHPAVLTDRGLDAAISAIAGRSPIPVEVEIKLKDRQPDEVEGTAYFVVVEALTNVAKHSQATKAKVSIDRNRGWLHLEITDNGRGGANPVNGTGIRGLRDRILALDGQFWLSSPPGKGTTIKVEIPCT